MTTVPRIMEMCKESLNDGTTEQQNRCGIYALALLKLVLGVILLFVLLFYFNISFMFGVPQVLYHVVFLSIAIFLDIADIIIGLITIISICGNYQEIMKMYYLYSIYIFGSITIFSCLAFYIIRGGIFPVFILFLIFLLILIMQMCLNHMLKKEVLMLTSDAPIPL